MKELIQCVWRASGAAFDVDAFLASHASLQADRVWHRGELSPPGRTRCQDSGFNALAGQGATAAESVAAMQERSGFVELIRAAHAAGAESELDFGVLVTPSRPMNAAFFDPALLRDLAALGVTVVVSAYAAADDESGE